VSFPTLPLMRFCLTLTLAAAVSWSLTGCGPGPKPAAGPVAGQTENEDDHDHADHDHGDDHENHDHGDHEHPETLAEGIAELEKAAANVAATLAEDAHEAADEAIHAAGHVVEDLQKLLAEQEDLAEGAKAAGTKALDELFAAFDEVDQAMHTGAEDAREKAAELHKAAAEKIAAAMKTLKQTLSGTEE
jgi:ElaB/YqjD/DUF883 family membrane-anchored ribosome-binding protein